jgi:putative redox protein
LLNRFGGGWLSPASEVFTMKVIIESIGRVGGRADVGGHTLVFDQPAPVPGGDDRGPSPLDVMSAAVGACAHYFAAAYLHARGLSPEGLAVEVTAEKARVPVSRIDRLELKVRLPARLDERHVAGIERAIKSCPAYGTLLHPPSVELSIERAAGAGTDEVSGDHRDTVVG